MVYESYVWVKKLFQGGKRLSRLGVILFFERRDMTYERKVMCN